MVFPTLSQGSHELGRFRVRVGLSFLVVTALLLAFRHPGPDLILPTVDLKTLEIQSSHHERSAARPHLPKIVFCAVFRNTQARNRQIFQKFLAMTQAITSEYHVVFYENDSRDRTREILLENLGWGNSSNVTLLFEDNVTEAPITTGFSKNSRHKTMRIARARNVVLTYVEDNFAHYDYLAMLDLDMICVLDPRSGDYDYNIFKYVLLELSDRWDALSFRQTKYYDWWALRYPPLLPGNLLFNDEKKHKKGENLYGYKKMEPMLDRIFQLAPFPDGLIEVESAFALLSFYKMSFIRQKKARYRGVDEENVTDCEHVAFHSDLLKMGARIRISPLTYCIPGKLKSSANNNTYRPLPPEISARMEVIVS